MGKFLNKFGKLLIFSSFIIGLYTWPYWLVAFVIILTLGILCIGLGRVIDLLEEIKREKYKKI